MARGVFFQAQFSGPEGFVFAQFFAALLQGRLLPAAELEAMETGPSFSGGYGLGLAVTSTHCGIAYGHSGDFPGWRNVVWASKNGRRVAVVMINVDDSRVSWNRLDGVARNALCSG